MSRKILVVFMAIILAGCSSSYNSVTQVNDTAFLQLSGNFFDTQLSIDNESPITLSEGSIETFKIDDKVVVKFPISTGKHNLKVVRRGEIIVNRIIYVTNSNIFEVKVP